MIKIGPDYVSAKFPYTTLMTWEFYRHRHSFWEFVICVKGSAAHYINEVKYVMCAGDILIIKPDSIHDYKLPDRESYAHYDYYASIANMKKACDDISTDSFKLLMENSEPVLLHTDCNTIGMLETYLSKLNNIQTNTQFKKLSLTLYNTLLRFICGLILEDLEQQKNNMPDWLSRILSLMSKPEILSGSLTGLVKQSNFSHGYLCRQFKNRMGQTLSEYFTKMKLDYSTVLLKNKDLNVLEVSLSLGYNSVSHFIMLFKKYYGLTPKKYRQRLGA